MTISRVLWKERWIVQWRHACIGAAAAPVGHGPGKIKITEILEPEIMNFLCYIVILVVKNKYIGHFIFVSQLLLRHILFLKLKCYRDTYLDVAPAMQSISIMFKVQKLQTCFSFYYASNKEIINFKNSYNTWNWLYKLLLFCIFFFFLTFKQHR